MKVYYAHHQYKYHSIEEEYELDLIRRYFPSSVIFNPSIDLKTSSTLDESIIMKECLETIGDSDILVFSSMNGVIGTGVYHEVKEAQRIGKPVFYIYHDTLYADFSITEIDDSKRRDRVYAFVTKPN